MRRETGPQGHNAVNGTLFQRNTGRLAGRWVLRGPDKRQVLAPAEIVTRKQAIAWAQAYQRENPTAPRRRQDGPTVRDVHERWLKIRDGLRTAGKLAKSTVQNNRTHLRAQILPTLGDTPLAAITIPLLRTWVRESLRGAPITQHNVFSTLAQLLDDAIGEGWVRLPANPAHEPSVRGLLPPAKATTKGVDLVFPLLTASELCNSPHVPAHRRVRYALAFTSGLRDGEISALRRCDVSQELIEVRHSLDYDRERGDTKTEGSVRILPTHPHAWRALAWWLEEGWALYTGREPGPTDPLFPNVSGGWSRPFSAKTLRGDLERIGAPTSVDGHPYAFRHTRTTFATWLRAAGVHRETIGKLLGHEGRSVTDRHYALAEMAELREAVQVIGLVITEVIAITSAAPDRLVFVAPPGRVELPTNGLGNRIGARYTTIRRKGLYRYQHEKRRPDDG